MKSLKKAARISRLAFLNALRLHEDSIRLFKNRSFPTAFQLSVLAQEEIGKSYIMEDHIFQMWGRSSEIDEEIEEIIMELFHSHKYKQSRFSSEADDRWKYGGKKFPKIIRDIATGKLEQKKQYATYVGLTKKNNKTNPKGRVTIPEKKISPKDAAAMITRVNDFVISLTEGIRRGVYEVDSEDLNEVLDMALVKQLEKLWSDKSKTTVARLKKIRKFKIEK